MGYEQLSLNGFVQEMREVTHGAHPRKFCFVLGAGASRSSGIKSGQELVKIWDRELRDRNEEEYHRWRKEMGITDENMSNYYSHYYEKRFYRCPADGLSYIEGIMESAKPSAGYVMLAHMLTATPHNVVITTNFDHLTEDAVVYYAQKTPLVIGHEVLSRYVVGQQVRPTIVKIHRDLLFDPKSRSEDLEKLPESWQAALTKVFENYHPVFIGYAGNDKSLMDFLIENSERFSNDEWKYPYWMLFKNDILEGKVKEFLTKSDGMYILHDGFDEVMIRLGAEFGYIIPTENEFLLDAKTRFSTLKDAIDAFSDKTNTGKMVERLTDSPVAPNEEATTLDESKEDTSNVNQAVAQITSQAEMQNMFHEASTFMQENKHAEAAKILERLVELDPKNARYHFRLADAFYSLQKFSDALGEATKAVELAPAEGIYFFLMGRILDEMGLPERALDAYKKSAELDPEESITHFATAKMHEKLGQADEALDRYRKASKCNPDWDKAHYAIAEILEEKNQFNEALLEYRITTELAPEWSMPHYSIARILVKRNQDEAALDEYQKAIELEPDWSLTYCAMAELLSKMNRNEEALKAIQKAISLDPDRSIYYISLSLILAKLERYEEAINAKSKADEIAKKDS